MRGWQIFFHSVRLVLNNLGAALRISLVLYLAQVAFQVSLMMQAKGDGSLQIPDFGFALNIFLFAIAWLIASLWIAVSWHRFVLVNEQPTGWIPHWHGRLILGYLGRSLLLGVIVLIVSVILGIIAAMLTAVSNSSVFALTYMAIWVGFGSYVFLRLSLILPAGTIEKKMTIQDAWVETAGASGTFIVLALVAAAASIVVQIPTMISGNPNSLISVLYNSVVGWFVMMISVSVFTTLYGHFVEDRPID